MYCGYITKLRKVRLHPNADRLKLAECFGNTVVVGLDAEEGEIGVYFPVDGKLGIEFAEKNNLLKRKNELGEEVGGYLDPENRNIRAMRLRGEKSDGLFCPLTSLASFVDLDTLNIGDKISELNGVTICEKYVPHRAPVKKNKNSPKNLKKTKAPIAPLFKEHKDTSQLNYNLSSFKAGDLIQITLKLHGTSGRTAYLPVLKGYRRSLLDKILKRTGKAIYEWDYITGSRKVVLPDLKDIDGGYYGSHSVYSENAKEFIGELKKGETVYYEIVGYTPSGGTIMGTCSNKKAALGPEFIQKYGRETIFNYDCEFRTSKKYIYRMTMTNEDGFIVEYSPEQIQKRCLEMGMDYVPVFTNFIIPERKNAGEYVKNIAEQYYDGADPIGKTHIREGVVVRIVNSPEFKAFKTKNFSFKCISGIIVEQLADSYADEDDSFLEN